MSSEDHENDMQIATWAYRALVLVGIGFLGIDIHGFGNGPWFVNALLYGSFVFVGIYITVKLVGNVLGGKEADLDVE